ncbi:MAG: dUTP diphosphatase [Oscillospiraceae bacterium]|nr:dUTP diphosphatase [Oscillospiraceae bacterium]
MNRVAKFSKVSYEQFLNDWWELYPEDDEITVQEIYDHIKLPKRATSGSAGYDFFLPVSIILNPDETLLIPTGIRAEISEGWVLQIFPRSGLGFKHRIQLDNTVGIIDSDYFHADNEGHIKIKLTNDCKDESTCEVDEGKGVAQGIFLPFGITDDDEADGVRTGGFGSTDRS